MDKIMCKQKLQEAGQTGKAVLEDSQAGLQTLKATGTKMVQIMENIIRLFNHFTIGPVSL